MTDTKARESISRTTSLTDAQMTSAAAFVEGGVQDACDDACSICLENFSEDDPATITVCKHEYHLQCILEWSQRSKECPMCWQPLYLKDEDSQLLLAASEQERTLRHQRSSPFYQHSSSFDSQFHRFGPTFTDDSDLEDRILHHLAAAGMGRAQQFTRRGESLRIRPSPNQGHSHIMIAPLHTNHSNASSSPLSSPVVSSAGNLFVQQSSPSNGHVGSSGVGTAQVAPLESTSGSSMSEPPVERGRRHKESSSMEGNSLRRQVMVDNVEGQERPSSPELTLSESFKSRLAAASSRYRESLTRTTKGFKERLRVRNGTMAELGTRAREVTAGVVRAIERMSLESPDKQRENSNNAAISSRDTDRNSSPMSERMDGAKLSSNSSNTFGETGFSGGGSASSSSTNSPPRNGVGSSSSRLASTSSANVEGNSNEGSSCSHDHKEHSVAPLAG